MRINNYQAAATAIKQAAQQTAGKVEHAGKSIIGQMSKMLQPETMERIFARPQAQVFDQLPVMRYGIIPGAEGSRSESVLPLYGIDPQPDLGKSSPDMAGMIIIKYGASLPLDKMLSESGPAGMLGHVVAQGSNRLEGMLRETKSDLGQLDPRGLDTQQKQELGVLREAYDLLGELVTELVGLREQLQAKLSGPLGR